MKYRVILAKSLDESILETPLSSRCPSRLSRNSEKDNDSYIIDEDNSDDDDDNHDNHDGPPS